MQSYEQRGALGKIYQNTENADGAVYIPARDKVNLFSDGHIFRTCAYCRVSTDHDEQLSSYELQQQHYRQLVGQHPNWDLKHIFADEGISGTSLKNRDEFNVMISECMAGKYDLIVTKSVSRFARNLVDCVSLVRMLKRQNPPVGVFFETDSLFTLEEDSELKLSMLATFAQEESVKKSESMNWSLKERFKNKKLLTPELFGYRRPRDAVGNFVKYGKLEIEESEAAVVRFIYNAFLAGYSIESIASILTDIGCKTKLGNTIWNEGSVSYILRNERYCGNVLTWKSFTADIFEHRKKRNRQDRDQYLYTNVHEPIVSVEQFDAVQVLLSNRKHGFRGGLPTMQVIELGAFQGYVPINHHWINDDPEVYYEASNSIGKTKHTRNIRRNYFSAFDLTGYQVVRGHFLTARSELPCITITSDKITFNCFCVRKFRDVDYIQLLLHPTERKIAIRPCGKKDLYCIPWRKSADKPILAKNISCSHFSRALFQIMNWHPDYSYKTFGTLIARGNDQIVVFNLSNAMPSISVSDRNAEKEKRAKRIAICPEEWGDSFGEEFYTFSLDNELYYSSDVVNWHLSEKSREVSGQMSFSIMSETDLLDTVKQLKLKVASGNE